MKTDGRGMPKGYRYGVVWLMAEKAWAQATGSGSAHWRRSAPNRAGSPGGMQLPPFQSPRYFTVRVNRNVARSLELAIPADPLLSAALQSQPAP